VGGGEPHDRVLALDSQPDPNLAPVAIAASPFHEAALHQSVGQADGAVMPDQQTRGDLSYSGTIWVTTWATTWAIRRAGKRPNRQQELMLLRLEALGPGRLFAEMEKSADVKAEIGESSIIRIRQIAGGRRRQVIRV